MCFIRTDLPDPEPPRMTVVRPPGHREVHPSQDVVLAEGLVEVNHLISDGRSASARLAVTTAP